MKTFSFIALTESRDLKINETNDPGASLLEELAQIFSIEVKDEPAGPKYVVRTFHQNTPELRERFEAFIEKYKPHNINIFQFRSYFQHLEEGEYFAFFPGEGLTPERSLDINHKLHALKENIPYEEVQRQHLATVGNLLDHYKIQGKDGKFKLGIGEPDKEKRRCRFCGRHTPDVQFKNVAHAIAEALGNKTLILYDECDTCNGGFGSANGIERSLINFVKPYTTFFGITGKRGVPKLSGKGFDIAYSNDQAAVPVKLIKSDIDIEDDIENSLREKKEFTRVIHETIVWQDLYRTLCKYTLSLLDSSELVPFQKTISWINREFSAEQLPRVAILRSYAFFRKQPGMLIYTRNNEDTELPFMVGEFHHTLLTFVFIMPFASNDRCSFTDEVDYRHFWSKFNHFNQVNGWRFMNMSRDEETTLEMELNFKQK